MIPKMHAIPKLKYKVYRNGKLDHVSYSQIHDEFLTVSTNTTIQNKIKKDLKFYTNLIEKPDRIEVYLNDVLKQTKVFKKEKTI